MAGARPTLRPRPAWSVVALSLTIAAALAVFLWPEQPLAPLIEQPPLGSWPVVELDGAIEVETGGAPVLCQRGRDRRDPALLFDPGQAERSVFELRTAPDFVFRLVFQRPGGLDVYSNDPSLPLPSQGQHAIGSASDTVRTQHWSWVQRKLSSVLTAGGSTSTEGEANLRFEIEAELDVARLQGHWQLVETSSVGPCWSRARGEGRFVAVPAAAAPVGSGLARQ